MVLYLSEKKASTVLCLLKKKMAKPKEIQGVNGSDRFGSRGTFDGEGKQTLDVACTAFSLARAIGM